VAVQPIRLFGDPVLRTPAVPVVDFDGELRRLVNDLTDTMLEAGGAGLAAPQIGVGLRVFTYNVDGVLGHLVNPTFDVVGDELQFGEGVEILDRRAENLAPGTIATLEAWDGSDAPLLVRDQDIDAGAVHEFAVTVVARLGPSMAPAAVDCVLEPGETGTGFLNVARLDLVAEAPAAAACHAALAGTASLPDTSIPEPARPARGPHPVSLGWLLVAGAAAAVTANRARGCRGSAGPRN
jgi:peptide deformylase